MDKDELIREAAREWSDGRLSAMAAIAVIHSLTHPAVVTESDLHFAHGFLQDHKDAVARVLDAVKVEDGRTLTGQAAHAPVTTPVAAALKERGADVAWDAVVTALSKVTGSEDWLHGHTTGAECAVAAIEKLAGMAPVADRLIRAMKATPMTSTNGPGLAAVAKEAALLESLLSIGDQRPQPEE